MYKNFVFFISCISILFLINTPAFAQTTVTELLSKRSQTDGFKIQNGKLDNPNGVPSKYDIRTQEVDTRQLVYRKTGAPLSAIDYIDDSTTRSHRIRSVKLKNEGHLIVETDWAGSDASIPTASYISVNDHNKITAYTDCYPYRSYDKCRTVTPEFCKKLDELEEDGRHGQCQNLADKYYDLRALTLKARNKQMSRADAFNHGIDVIEPQKIKKKSDNWLLEAAGIKPEEVYLCKKLNNLLADPNNSNTQRTPFEKIIEQKSLENEPSSQSL